MGAKYVMALDQGTTSSRCILFDKKGKICSMAQKEFHQYYPRPGWVEHDPKEIWSSQLSVATEAMGKLGVDAEDIAAIGITNQRETTVVWEKETGEPIYPAIVWQCRRTAPMIDRLEREGFTETLKEKTGLIPDAYFSATKIQWILEHVEGARERAKGGELLFGTIDTWLIWKLTKGEVHVTDYTNASRTMLFDIHQKQWDEELLEKFQIPRCMMPQVKPSSCVYGYTNEKIIGGRIPIGGAAGDQQAALFGQCCTSAGDVKNTYGTGCFLLMHTGNQAVESRNGLLTTLAVNGDGTAGYALEGSVFVAGAALQWLRDELGILEKAPESEKYCLSVSDSGGVYVVPAFTGLGAPYWDPYARGAILGLTRGSQKAHIIRATVESLAYQTNDVIQAMEQDSGIRLNSLRVDGGASANNFLMQFQSNLLDAQVVRPKCIETTAMGAAYLAGLATGFWDNIEEVQNLWERERIFAPSISEGAREKLLNGWKKAVKCTRGWAEP
ncbi:glycerol kinase [Blautia sp. An249]|uniref:glycerol kinase GlpK n=1 Tax=Blautia sp. An249 TaxID=1965603 RepID=UPI000B3AE29E|nr:glycerol kinase GlpK [Blautia sp. An249]OUO80643.1 glycerol kinase [Blautia sp. An249]